MSGLLGDLDPTLLYVCTFGPGFGESTLVRVPPDKWIVIDGCLIRGTSPAADILSQRDEDWACVIMTHPHADHASGLVEVLDLPGAGPVGCTDLGVDNPTDWITNQDPSRHVAAGAVEQALSAISDRWERFPEQKWVLRQGAPPKQIGAAELTVLHPDSNIVRTYGGSRLHLNRLSAPILLEWAGVRLVLGADVISADWANIGRLDKDLARHHSLKVPHHGSLGAVSPTFCEGADKRSVWVVTPYGRGAKLPRFEDEQGSAHLLSHVNMLRLTGLPRKYDLQGAVPYRVTRQDLREGREPQIVGEEIFPGAFGEAPADPSDVHSCWVMAAFRSDSPQAEMVSYGAGALEIIEAMSDGKSPVPPARS